MTVRDPAAVTTRRLEPNVVFAYMPWATTTRPSLALGILTSLCHEQQVPVRTLYANLDMSGRIGFEAAGQMANERCLYGLSEHLFACDMFGAEVLSSDIYLEALAKLALPDMFKDMKYLRMLRDELVPEFLNNLEARIIAAKPSCLGLSSTFNQVMGSLAIAARIKRALPEVKVIAGGACFDDEMGQEYHRGLPHVLDHVFMGEAEAGFREFLRRHKAGEPTVGIPGVTWLEEKKIRLIEGGPLPDLNESPAPNYDDFFIERERVREETGKIFNIEFIPFEGSRGCWWGQKNHCVFCGINPDLMSFREKPVERTVAEMVALSQRYRVMNLTASDYIVSRKQRKELFARLAEVGLDIECFYEVRADLNKEEIATMRKAGIVKVQPGIESFSTELLRLMKKGTSRIRHVQFLRWAKEYGIHLSYNILNGFPGERAEWYHAMAAFIPQIRHLQPPLHNVHRVEMHRFSPLFRERVALGVDDYQLRQDYCFNFPDGLMDPLKIGYFFSFSAGTVLDPETYVGPLKAVLADWIEAQKTLYPPEFYYLIGPGFTRVVDHRGLNDRYIDLADLNQDVFLLCDEITTVDRLERDLRYLYPREVASGEVAACVRQMLDSGLLMQEDNTVLMLPIARHPRPVQDLRDYVLDTTAAQGIAAE
jgi:ribosomal peptide maturation radical SAM protein 1